MNFAPKRTLTSPSVPRAQQHADALPLPKPKPSPAEATSSTPTGRATRAAAAAAIVAIADGTPTAKSKRKEPLRMSAPGGPYSPAATAASSPLAATSAATTQPDRPMPPRPTNVDSKFTLENRNGNEPLLTPMSDDASASASNSHRTPRVAPSPKAPVPASAVQSGNPAPGTNGTPVQERQKRSRFAELNAAGVPAPLNMDTSADDKEDVDKKASDRPDTSSDAMLARTLAAGGVSDQNFKRRSSQPRAEAAAAAAAIDVNADADGDQNMNPNAADTPGRDPGQDSDEHGFKDVKLEKEHDDSPITQSLIRLGTTILSTAALPDRTTLWINLIAQKSKARARAGRDAVLPAIELLDLGDNPAASGADIYTACTYAQISIGKTLPRSTTTHAGFQGTEQDPLVEVQLLFRFAATYEPAATKSRSAASNAPGMAASKAPFGVASNAPAVIASNAPIGVASMLPFEGDFKYSECTEKGVASKMVSHLLAVQNHITPVSAVAISLCAVLQERKLPGHSVEFGKLALSVFSLGPLASTTKQSEVTALVAPICSAAVPLLVRCEGKAMDKALVIVPSRYAAPETMRQPRANGAKQAYKNVFSLAASVNDKPYRTIAAERHGIEAIASLYLASLRFPAHFQLRKLVRKRVCARCLGTDHAVSRCKGKEICRNCCAEDCTVNCPYPAQCGICGRAHRTTTCNEYRGLYAEPTENYTDLPGRPPGTGKAMNIQGIPEALQAVAQAQLLATLAKQAECWTPDKGSDDQVWGVEPDVPECQNDTWRQLTPSAELLKLANTTRWVVRASGKKQPSRQEVVPPDATQAKQWIEQVQQIDMKLLGMALAGMSNAGCCSVEDIPAPPLELQKAGLTVDNSWEYKSPQQLTLIDATQRRIEPGERRNRNSKAKGRTGNDAPPKENDRQR